MEISLYSCTATEEGSYNCTICTVRWVFSCTLGFLVYIGIFGVCWEYMCNVSGFLEIPPYYTSWPLVFRPCSDVGCRYKFFRNKMNSFWNEQSVSAMSKHCTYTLRELFLARTNFGEPRKSEKKLIFGENLFWRTNYIFNFGENLFWRMTSQIFPF